jgi:F0F1-type ATP synthase delta subunit
MNDSKISVRYSRALFQSALERNILDKVNQDMVSIAEICKEAETKEFLHNPVIVPSKRQIYCIRCSRKSGEITLSLFDLG